MQQCRLNEGHWMAKYCAATFKRISLDDNTAKKFKEVEEKMKKYPSFYESELALSAKWLKMK